MPKLRHGIRTEQKWYGGTIPKATDRHGVSSSDQSGGRVVDTSRLPSLLLFLILFSMTFCTSTRAKDLDVLIRYLVPAFLAQNFAAVCQADDPKFLSELTDKSNDANAFSQHIKLEIIAGLTSAETQFVLVSAAKTARHAARTEFKKFSPNYPELPTEPLRKWCQGIKPYILRVIGRHFKEHKDFLRIIGQAKLHRWPQTDGAAE
jgi:hypothetical protein